MHRSISVRLQRVEHVSADPNADRGGRRQVTLIERNPTFISCPISNLVIGGTKTMENITVSYDGLKNKWGVRVIQDDVVAVDAAKKTVSLKAGGTMTYDRLVLPTIGEDGKVDRLITLSVELERQPEPA